tara:strand:+ start:3339 stop:3704 length:366 start_codon:yes stop_codon:yes gene_type:complete
MSNSQNENMVIATTIKRQIHDTVLMCAGAHDFVMATRGLRFTIQNTSKFSRERYVFIHLAYNDTYKIKIVNPKTFKTEAEATDIYADELSHILETLWETEETLKVWRKMDRTYDFTKVVKA